MLTLTLLHSALAAPPSDAVPSALERWTARLSLAIPEGCRTAEEGEGGLRVDCGGTALLLETARGEDARQTALERQTAPFAMAGISVADPEPAACTLRGQPADCLTVTISIPPGAPMVLISGAGEDWVGTCLHRGGALPEVCRSVFDAG